MNSNKKDFFDAIFKQHLNERNGYIETREFIPKKPTKQIFHKTIDEVLQYVPEGNFYFGVCPRSKKSGKAENIEMITALWVDIDAKEQTKEEILERLKQFKYLPSGIVDSGNGIHAYWLLNKPEKTRENTKGVLKGLAKALAGDLNCHDLPRILRVPGSFNLKDPTDPKEVKIISLNPELRYELSGFDHLYVPINECNVGGVVFSEEIKAIDLNKLRLSRYTKALIRSGKKDGDRYSSKSEADYRVVCDMIECGCTDDDIKAVFLHNPIGEKYRRQGDSYLKRTIANARAKSKKRNKRDAPMMSFSYLGGDAQGMDPSDIAQPAQEQKKKSAKKEKAKDKKSAQTKKDTVKKETDYINTVIISTKIRDQHRLINCGDDFYEYSEGCYRMVSEKVVRRWIADMLGIRASMKKTKDIIYHLEGQVYLEAEKLNDTEHLNLRNGLFDISTYALLNHTPEVYSSIQLNVKYDPAAKCDKWHKFLDSALESDKSKINIIQEYMGLCLTKETRYEKALIMEGEGANGKSTIIYVIEHLIGKQNCSAVPLEKLSNSFYVASLFNKLINVCSGTSAKAKDYVTTFNKIVSGDSLKADNKFKNPFEFNPYCKLIFAVNTLPWVEDKSDAPYRRMLLLEFKKVFAEEVQNKNLKYELAREELDGIFLWCLEGLKRLRARGYFDRNKEMQEAIYELKKENNNVIVFVEEGCELNPEKSAGKEALYNWYRHWCANNGYTMPLTMIRFGKELKSVMRQS